MHGATFPSSVALSTAKRQQPAANARLMWSGGFTGLLNSTSAARTPTLRSTTSSGYDAISNRHPARCSAARTPGSGLHFVA